MIQSRGDYTLEGVPDTIEERSVLSGFELDGNGVD